MKVLTPEQIKKRNDFSRDYYYLHKERINQQNIENHKKPEIVEYIKKFRKRICKCLVCDQDMTYDTFRFHKYTKKHTNNFINYNQSEPIMIIQA